MGVQGAVAGWPPAHLASREGVPALPAIFAPPLTTPYLAGYVQGTPNVNTEVLVGNISDIRERAPRWPDPLVSYFLNFGPKPPGGLIPSSPSGLLRLRGAHHPRLDIRPDAYAPAFWLAWVKRWPALGKVPMAAPKRWPRKVEAAWFDLGLKHITPEAWAACVMPMDSNLRAASPLFRDEAVWVLSALAHGVTVASADAAKAADAIEGLLGYVPLYQWAANCDLTTVPLPTIEGTGIIEKMKARQCLVDYPLETHGKDLRLALAEGVWSAARLQDVPRLPWTPRSRRTACLVPPDEPGRYGWYKGK